MTKDKIVDALRNINEGEKADYYHDELETAIAVVIEAADDAVEKAWAELCEDRNEE